MTVITHKDLEPWLDRLRNEPYYQIGNKTPYNFKAWYAQEVILEVPLGELAGDFLKRIALAGDRNGSIVTIPLTGKEGFNAQGLEGKVQIRKPLANALLNLRDIVPEYRGRILMSGRKEEEEKRS